MWFCSNFRAHTITRSCEVHVWLVVSHLYTVKGSLGPPVVYKYFADQSFWMGYYIEASGQRAWHQMTTMKWPTLLIPAYILDQECESGKGIDDTLAGITIQLSTEKQSAITLTTGYNINKGMTDFSHVNDLWDFKHRYLLNGKVGSGQNGTKGLCPYVISIQ